MNSAVIIAALALVALAILVPTDAHHGVSIAASHQDSKSSSAEKESSKTGKKFAKHVNGGKVFVNEENQSSSDDVDKSESSFDEKVVEGPNGITKSKSVSSKKMSIDRDQSKSETEVKFVADQCGC